MDNDVNEVYATYAGPIDNQTSNGFFGFFGAATHDKIAKIHLLIQSSGGVIGDAVAIHNFIRGCPIEVVTYNCGAADSAAVLIYLAGDTRYVADTAAFMIHPSTWTSPCPIPLTKQALLDRSNSLEMEDIRTRTILGKHLILSPDMWSVFETREMIFTATKAVEFGLSTNIGLFTPKAGSRVMTIERK